MLNRFMTKIIQNSFKLKFMAGTGFSFSLLDKLIPSLIYSDTDKLENNEPTIAQKNSTKIIKQAFKDAGYNHNVLVEYKQFEAENILAIEYPPLMQTLSFLTPEGKPATYVQMQYSSESQLLNLQDTYAISGHEAIHSLHHHTSTYAMTKGMLWGLTLAVFLERKNFSSFLFRKFPAIFMASYFIQLSLAKLQEIDADVTSAKKLGTAKLLSGYFGDLEKHNNFLIKNEYHSLPEEKKSHITEEEVIFYTEKVEKIKNLIFDEHPSFQTRINLIKFFNPIEKKPLLLQSPIFEEIQSIQSNMAKI